MRHGLRRFPLLAALVGAVTVGDALLNAGSPQMGRASPRAVLIMGGTLIDGTGAPPRHNDGILI